MNWDSLNSENPPDSTYITSQRQSNRNWGTSQPNEHFNLMDLPRPEHVLDTTNNDIPNIYKPSLPHPNDMINPHDNLEQFTDGYHVPHYDYKPRNIIPLKPQQESLVSILSNLIYSKSLDSMDKYNHIMSPYSLYYILLCLLIGSNEETFTELANFISITNSDILPDLTIESIKLHKELIQTDSIKMKIMNGFFVDNRFQEHITPTYVEFIKKVGKLHPVNFSNKRQSLDYINGWVKDATRGLITNLLDTSNLDEMTRMIMVNVIYFKADWKNKFNKSITNIQPFFQSCGLQTKLPLMSQESTEMYFEDSKYQYLSLSYNNPNFVMDFILPNKNNNDFPIQNIHTFIDSYTNHQRKQKVKIYIPKFKQRTKQSLKKMLRKNNVNKIFNPYQAELYNIAKFPSNIDRIYVSDIIQEAVIIVDEEGSEAAAATAATLLYNCASLNEPSVPIFRADRTFQYSIRYLPTNTILFTGVFDG